MAGRVASEVYLEPDQRRQLLAFANARSLPHSGRSSQYDCCAHALSLCGGVGVNTTLELDPLVIGKFNDRYWSCDTKWEHE